MPIHGKLEGNFEAKSSADMFWGALRDGVTLYPKAFPNVYKAVEVLEGDGKAVDSVLQVTFSEDSSYAKPITEKIEAVDDAKKTIIYDVNGTDGDVFQNCKKFKLHISVTPKGDGSHVKVAVDYEKPNQNDPNPTSLIEVEVQDLKELDVYLQNQ